MLGSRSHLRGNVPGNNNTSHPVKKLTSKEMREKRDKGLCFYCNEKYVAGHKCKPQKMLRLDILPDEDGEELDCGVLVEEVEEPQPPIELSASSLAGVARVSSIRVVGKILGKVSFLVDLGVIHNFVNPVTTTKLGLQLQNTHSFAVEVADGEKVVGNCYCRAAKLTIHGFESYIDLLVAPLGDAQVILGTV